MIVSIMVLTVPQTQTTGGTVFVSNAAMTAIDTLPNRNPCT